MTGLPTISEQVRNGPLLGELTANEIQRLLGKAEFFTFHAGDAFFTEGDEGEDMYLLLEGSAEVCRNERAFAVQEAGSIFGEMGMLDPAPRAASVVATAKGSAFRLHRDAIMDLLAQKDDVGIKVLRALTSIACARLQEVNELVQEQVIGPKKKGILGRLWGKISKR